MRRPPWKSGLSCVKMLLKKSLLETLTLISCSGSLFCLVLNFIINISPLKGVWFSVYASFVFCVSLTFSFRLIQWLLHLNKPLHWDFERLLKDYPYLSPIKEFIPTPRPITWEECKEYDTNELSVITTVLERKLVSSWYVPFVSQEIGFPFACKQLLDQIVGKAFQISHKIDTKEVFIDVCTIFTIHLKEYKKALKRREKSPEKDIESLYKPSHLTINDEKNHSTTEHFTDILPIILKELVPWELWDTPHSELLIRILAKKLDSYIDTTLANPEWLNDKLLNALKNREQIDNSKIEQTTDSLSVKSQKETKDVTGKPKLTEDVVPKNNSPKSESSETPENLVQSAFSSLINQNLSSIQKPFNGEAVETDFHCNSEVVDELIDDIVPRVNGSAPVDIQSSPVMRHRRGRHGRDEVKIYDRVIEGSVKTWETVGDLQCVSMGTDLLTALGEEMRLSRLWEDEARDQGTGTGEEDMELDSKETSPVRKDMAEASPRPESSPKPTEALLKDFQSTVHQAKTKIGDLQVSCNDLDVKHDEAAGMMEGLLDFGIAGLRKGLRLTRLGDEAEKSPKEGMFEKFSPSVERRRVDTVTNTTVHREDNGPVSVPPLVKQQRVTSQDSVSLVRPKPRPPPLPAVPSPEPEYEEAEDLSTSIAKLRSLLQQRERDSNMEVSDSKPSRSESVWWDGAEETRGRSQGHHSSRAVDTATVADEYDHSNERNSPSTEPNQTTNNMQRLDKFLNRAVTGVFNTILTAVGAEADGAPPPPVPAALPWDYQPTQGEHQVGNAVAKLVSSRRAYNHVDAALDSLEQLPASKRSTEASPEDFEEWCAVYGRLWCCVAELVCAAGAGVGGGTAHAGYRGAAAIMADVSNSLITSYLADLTTLLRRQVFVLFEQLNQQPVDQNDIEELKPFDIEETCQTILEAMPVPLQLLGEETLSNAVNLLVSSVSHKQLNKQLLARMMDLLALHFHTAAASREPSILTPADN